eukprot:4548910-Alexandrium_andersonii.AAC.1
MSASLVGSEMCIRDRNGFDQGPGTSPCTAIPPLVRASVASGLSGWATAVSYTHLTLPTICSV